MESFSGLQVGGLVNGFQGRDFYGVLEKPNITFADVGGMDKLKEEIRLKIIHPLVHPEELYKAYGKSVGGGILLFGPPGCGKTYLARATAGEVKAHFLSVGIHEILDMYIGQSERNLHEIFQTARRNRPCVLFFDEVDALGMTRADLRHTNAKQENCSSSLGGMVRPKRSSGAIWPRTPTTGVRTTTLPGA